MEKETEIAALWNEYYEPVRRFVDRETRGNADAEDIVQDAFVKIYKHRNDLQDERKIKPWIYRIVRNTIADHYRKRKPLDAMPDDLSIAAEAPPEPDYAREVIACFETAIPRLPDIYREALELSELQGLPQKQLAERLGISYSAAKSRVQRGRELLKELLTGCCHIESDAYGHIIDFRIVLAEYRDPPKKRKKARSADKLPLSICSDS
ncbi:RNA polymerase sigma factor SigZ [Cohnella zeiphila]|uniref:RNA polymerase sigma factor n=1 Tax=Cohnella zeiphila TaxID=2761120 RepID=A0A7X0SUL0_9BACL|nr:RNA polymerase sigma factor SigZ [Cohnella zeiphila]MBB6735195.1 RNA polymerase sigma factor SigZ [Cohnella zeiphila]